MTDFSAGEVIEQAVQTEKLGYELYLEMAKRFEKDEQLRQLFETLAVKEHEHEKTFSSLKDKVSTDGVENWEEVSRYLRSIVESEFFLGKNKSLPSLEHLANIDDAVRYAIGFEKETLLYFFGLRDLVREKDVIDRIITEEKSHLAWLGDYRKKINK